MSKTIPINAAESTSIMVMTSDDLLDPWLAISYHVGFFRIETDETTSSQLRKVADELERLQALVPKVCPVTLDPVFQDICESITTRMAS